MRSVIQFLNPVWKGTLRAYPQIFFSDKLYLGLILLIVSFFDVTAGLSGLLVALTTNFSAMAFGLDSHKIEKGIYAFNSVLTGLGIGLMYQPDFPLFIILIFTGILCLAITVMFEGIMIKYGLPFLSIPFLLTTWILILATRDFTALDLSERGIYYFNYLYSYGGNTLVDFYQQTQNLPLPQSLLSYFSSLGAIFFQPSVFAGIIIAIGLFFTSRISLLFSLVGFYSGWLFFQWIGGDIVSLSYSHVGFNFILTAIAIGGFFVIPSWRGLLLVIVITPVNVIFTQAMMQIFGIWQLPIYSLSFNFVVITFLYILKFRVRFISILPEVRIQEYSPEKNLYSYRNYLQRFGSNEIMFPFRLPFWGEWSVDQGHDGKITHTYDYKYAWDFTVRDNDNKTFRKPGTSVDDFYCYKKAILSPGYGKIVKIIDGIEDNAIGSPNLVDNWGNCIIIKHNEYLYSKLCHILNGSFKVSEGDYVFLGQVMAMVGNSGRSPEPHLHMQFQATPWVGSPTIKYPISHFVTKNNQVYSLKNYDYPIENEIVFNPEPNKLLAKIFEFIPGKKMAFEVMERNKLKTELWTIYTDSLNKSYIYSETSKSLAWFSNDKNMLYFHHFKGNRNSFLYHFYLAFYKVQTAFYKDVEITDEINLSQVYKPYQLFLNDIFAPFHMLLKAKYKITYANIDDDLSPSKIDLKSEVSLWAFRIKIKQINYSIHIKNEMIDEIIISKGNRVIKAKQIS